MNGPLSEWLRVMLEEIARKRQDSEHAASERSARAEEADALNRTHGAGPRLNSRS